jgi:catechol-2,3-dioxygenase
MELERAQSRIEQDEETVIAPSLHHVFLKTTRYEQMREWYATAAGFRPTFVFADGNSAFLTNDDANHRIVLFTSPQIVADADQRSHAGMHHMAFEYDSLEDLVTSYRRLRRQGIVPHACLNHGPCTSFYYEDPDGNSVEMQADNFGDWAQSRAFMATAEFAAEPIGIQVDPERLADALEAGASAEEINRRSYAGEFDPGTPLDLHLPV